MTINKKLEAAKLELLLEGRLDTTTSPMLEAELKQSIEGVTELVFDFEKLEYISSAGLRILLAAQKIISKSTQRFLIYRHRNIFLRSYRLHGDTEKQICGIQKNIRRKSAFQTEIRFICPIWQP